MYFSITTCSLHKFYIVLVTDFTIDPYDMRVIEGEIYEWNVCQKPESLVW